MLVTCYGAAAMKAALPFIDAYCLSILIKNKVPTKRLIIVSLSFISRDPNYIIRYLMDCGVEVPMPLRVEPKTSVPEKSRRVLEHQIEPKICKYGDVFKSVLISTLR